MAVTFVPHTHPAFQKIQIQSVKNGKPYAVFNPSECVLPEYFKNDLDRILDFEVREDDVWVISYPRSGTTWTQEMVWLLMNNLDYQTAKEIDITRRFPFIEFASLQVPFDDVVDEIKLLNNQSSPRCIKSHLPKELLPRQLWTKRPKIIYVARDPKDVVVSYFHHHKCWMAYTGPFETIVEAFLDDALQYGPYWKHILGFWDIRGPHVLFNTYESMKKDLVTIIRKTATFLKKKLTEEEVSKLAEHLSFESMKDNPSVNYKDILAPIHKKFNIKTEFMRKGESDTWKEEMSPELVARFDEWNMKKLQDSDFPFYHRNN